MPMPKSILQDIIKLRHMSGEEIREYFQKRADFHNSNPRNRYYGRTAKDWAIDQEKWHFEKWHSLKNERTYSKHFE
jgi:hypothetical protein